MKFSELVRKTKNTISDIEVNKISKAIPITEERKQFYSDNSFKKYDCVISEDTEYRILEKCSNYYTVVDTEGNISKKFANSMTPTEDIRLIFRFEPLSFHGYEMAALQESEYADIIRKYLAEYNEEQDDIALLKFLKEENQKIQEGIMETDYKLRDKITIAKMIADAVGIPHDPVSTPDVLVNTAIRKARKDPAIMRNKEIFGNMLSVARGVGIKFSDTTFDAKGVTESTIDENALNAWKNRMHAAGATHYISGKHPSGSTSSKLHAYKKADGKKIKVGAFDQVKMRGISEDTKLSYKQLTKQLREASPENTEKNPEFDKIPKPDVKEIIPGIPQGNTLCPTDNTNRKQLVKKLKGI